MFYSVRLDFIIEVENLLLQHLYELLAQRKEAFKMQFQEKNVVKDPYAEEDFVMSED